MSGYKDGKYRWKGRIVSEKVYLHRVKLASRSKNVEKRGECVSEEIEVIPEYELAESYDFVDGRRIVEFPVLGKDLWCFSCKECLSLDYIEREIREGFGSKLTVRCHKCLILNIVHTGKQHHSNNEEQRQTSRFDINSKVALGIIHSGMAFAQMEKLCACMNVPCFNYKTFKKYKKEVGDVVEVPAKKRCEKATDMEKSLTIDHTHEIEQLL